MRGASAPAGPISDADVTRLISGKEIETVAFYDVSDQQIYGRKHLRRLTGDYAERASLAGCEPVVYQTVLWWCLVYIPVRPLAIYLVMPCLECDDPDGDADQYRVLRVEWDSGTVIGTPTLRKEENWQVDFAADSRGRMLARQAARC